MAKKQRSIGSVEMDTGELALMAVALVFGYKLILKPILDKVGISADNAKIIADQKQVPAGQNPFTSGYTETEFNIAPADMQSIMVASKTLYETDPDNTSPLVVLAEKIYNGFGYLSTDSNGIISAINSIVDKESVGLISDYLFVNYGVDLLTLLQHGKSLFMFIDAGVNGEDLAAIIKHINSLPETSPDASSGNVVSNHPLTQ